MSERIRAKFRVNALTDVFGTDGAKNAERIELGAVTTTGAETAENPRFYKATPVGEVRMQIENPDAFEFFRKGSEFYADFTPAPTRCGKCYGGGAEWYVAEGTTYPNLQRPCPRCGGSGLEPQG